MDTNTASLEATIEQLKLMIEAASHTAQLLQQQLNTAKSLMASASNAHVSHIPAMPTEDLNTQTMKRDYSEWRLPNGDFYPKGVFVLELFRLLVKEQYTLDQLTELFETDKVYPREVRGNKVVFKLESEVSKNEESRFHTESILTKDKKKILVTNQIGTNNFPDLIQYLAKHFGFPIKGIKLTRGRWPHPALPPFTEPNVEFV